MAAAVLAGAVSLLAIATAPGAAAAPLGGPLGGLPTSGLPAGGLLSSGLLPGGLLPGGEATVIGPYADPGFAAGCDFLQFGEGERPPLALIGREPLCVEYQKRDITVDNGGALGFVLAEPARFAIAIPACRYWQLDHWSVQVSPGSTRLVGWDGSYWFDKSAGTAGARLADFTLAGQPVDAGQVADALRPYQPELADLIAGAQGVSLRLPAGLPCPGLPR